MLSCELVDHSELLATFSTCSVKHFLHGKVVVIVAFEEENHFAFVLKV